MSDLRINLGGLHLKNPVTVASGTFNFGKEFSEFYDISSLGGISVKGLTLEPRLGNDPPRLVETHMGLINSVGLQNPGIESFLENDLPFLEKKGATVIANINGNTISDYEELARILSNTSVSSIEVNISCPNVKNGGMLFGVDPVMAGNITKAVRNKTNKHIIVKLSPNVTDIGLIAKAVEANGADAISLINTVSAMAIDIETQKPILKRVKGGLSGPSIKPIALRMVYDVYDAVKIPILGMGGITSANDAIEFILAGASAVAIGTANFVDPFIAVKVINGIEEYMNKKGYKEVSQMVGLAHR
jgi:dihydroorotate dehydrogenase (NAD+) catalytic subunit